MTRSHLRDSVSLTNTTSTHKVGSANPPRVIAGAAFTHRLDALLDGGGAGADEADTAGDSGAGAATVLRDEASATDKAFAD